MKNRLSVIGLLALCAAAQAQPPGASTLNKKGNPSDDFHFIVVASDRALKAMGKTREQYNAECPVCEADWRTAWAVKGTKKDMLPYENVRLNTAPPMGSK